MHWGRARRDVCDALMRRARRLIDLHELFLKPSHAGLQALCLYAQLFHMSDLSTSDRDPWAKSESRPPSFTEPTSRMMHSIVVEQLKTLEIDWTCSLVISNSDEDHGAAALARRKYR